MTLSFTTTCRFIPALRRFTMSATYFYDTEVEWSERRRGKLCSDGLPEVEIAAPPEFQGDEGTWTPEHLFVCSVNVCFMTTFLAISELSKLNFSSFKSYARGKLEKTEGQGYRVTQVILRPALTIHDARDKERAARILEK